MVTVRSNSFKFGRNLSGEVRHGPRQGAEMSRFSGWARRLTAVLVLSGAVVALPVQEALAAPPLTTPWTAEVTPDNALPEYPRPQLVRSEWQNLNGLWQFAATGSITTPPTGQNLAEQVLVPYPIESGLSRIQRHEDRMWYRRTFTVPAGWSGRRVRLNFGAVSWETRVWVNGTQVGTHNRRLRPVRLRHHPGPALRLERAHRRRVRPRGRDGRPDRQAAPLPRRHLLHRALRHLADRVDGAGQRREHHPPRHHP
ncbi:hypothetical protein GCM10020220_035280 [Nonomuraea rubra]